MCSYAKSLSCWFAAGHSQPESASLLASDIFRTAQAGAGGTDAQDWAEMLERMYLRWASAQGFSTHVTDRSAGTHAMLPLVICC